MKTQLEIKLFRYFIITALAMLPAFFVFAIGVNAQAPPNPVPAPENIASGAFIIPMDNYHQGNAGQTTFNLRAYGLANLLLQNNVPVKWAINSSKLSKDAEDFTASFTRVTPGSAGDASGTASFSGGPFIIPTEYESLVLSLINSFNSGPENDVTVYRTTADASINIRYTLSHKPKIAIGPDGGGFGGMVHERLFDSAGIGPDFYDSVNDNIIDSKSCYTIATQAHSEDPRFVGLYRSFVENGGNLLLQCASIGTFENSEPFGHFQSSVDYLLFGTNGVDNSLNTTLIYPDGSMPFNQFIGILANQDGAVTEYRTDRANFINDNRVAVVNSGSSEANDTYVATVSDVTGEGQPGGAVFELGGHDYVRTESGASEIERLNGQRMILNAVFVPVTRPEECLLQAVQVSGFKSVRRLSPFEGGPVGAGDTIRWTIDYINNSQFEIRDFQITDAVGAHLTFVANSNIVVQMTNGSTALRNSSYNGVTNTNLLADGAILTSLGRIRVTVDMRINGDTSNGTVLQNQTFGAGTLAAAAASDNIDATTTNIFGKGNETHPNSVPQTQRTEFIDPTTVTLSAPLAANGSIEGVVRDVNGNGISRARITVLNASTSETSSVITNPFGYYYIGDLPIGNFYSVSVSHKRYRFANPTIAFSLNDDVAGLAFVADAPGGFVKAGAVKPSKIAVRSMKR